MIPRLIRVCLFGWIAALPVDAQLEFSVRASEIAENQADISVFFSYQTSSFNVSSASMSVQVRISAATDRSSVIHTQSSTTLVTTAQSAYGSLPFTLHQPQFWTDEFPHLYSADFTLLKQDQVMEHKRILFGIRGLSISRSALYINHQPLRIQGINYRIDPNRWREDLQLMRELHLNAIRVIGEYPPAAFLAACDRMGIYVVCVPPDDLVTKSQVPSHPSILAWELTSQAEREAKVRSLRFLDPTRLIVSVDASVGSGAGSLYTPLTLAPDQWMQRRDLPLLLFAYPSVSAGKAEGLEELPIRMDASSHLAGAFLHRFEEIVTNDRQPNSIAKLIRKAFSPIQLQQDEATIQPGINDIQLKLINRYRQTHLTDLRCRWTVFEDQKAIQSGTVLLNLPPGQSFDMTVRCKLSDEITRHFYFMTLDFFIESDRHLHRHVARLLPSDWREQLVLRLDDLKKDEEWRVEASAKETRFHHRQFLFRDTHPHAGWFLMTQDGNVRLITGGPYLVFDEDLQSSTPSLIQNLWIHQRHVDRLNQNITVDSILRSVEPDPAVTLEMTTLFSPFGFVDVRYSLKPSEPIASPDILGLAFRLPSTLQHIHYVGKGPYPAYPGSRALNEYGIFSFLDGKAFVPGNREKLTLAAFTGSHGYGLGILMLDGSLSILPSEKGTMLSVNAAIAGKGSRDYKTAYPIETAAPPRGGFSAAFRLIPLPKNQYPKLFQSTFP